MSACDYCATRSDELVDATIIDDSGGAGVELCADCRHRADTQRCGLCGEPVDPYQKADGVIFHDDLARKSGTAICDDCRRDTVFRAADAREGR